ncbi:hypothetical protein [Chelativorans sp. AA-79]|nr:hypothetical protein [Chelativorans sp. AA-79]WEX07576.1 hypothetical protein PVE73_15825 [Chelativorans sp. AA-79]
MRSRRSRILLGLTLALGAAFLSIGLNACATTDRPPCGIFDRGFPLCGI